MPPSMINFLLPRQSKRSPKERKPFALRYRQRVAISKPEFRRTVSIIAKASVLGYNLFLNYYFLCFGPFLEGCIRKVIMSRVTEELFGVPRCHVAGVRTVASPTLECTRELGRFIAAFRISSLQYQYCRFALVAPTMTSGSSNIRR